MVFNADEPDWNQVRGHYDEGHSPRDCRARFGIDVALWQSAVARGKVVLRPRSPRPAGKTRSEVARLLREGLSQAAIARTLGVSRPTVCFHARRLGVEPRSSLARRYDWNVIAAYYGKGHSAKECQAHFGCSRSAWAHAVRRGMIVPRPRLEPTEALLTAGSRRCRHHVKGRLLLDGIKAPCCEACGISEWRGRRLPLELHHVNGDGLDNRVDNLLLLCPNCHSQTDTWGVRNRGRGQAA